MKLLIEVENCVVKSVWCSEPDGAEVIIRDLDCINSGFRDEEYDPLVAIPGLKELRVPHFVIY